MTDRADVDILAPGVLDKLVQTRPADALALSREWLTSHPAAGVDRVVVRGGMARALFELGLVEHAVENIRRIDRERDHSDGSIESDPRVVSVYMSGAAILAEAGLVDDALERLDLVEQSEALASLGRVLVQRAYVLTHAGRPRAALEQFERAELLLVEDGDELGVLRLAVNRGVVQLQRGQLTEAEGDFRRADSLAQTLGQTAMRAGIASNLGIVFARRRQLRDALRQFDIARAIHAEVGQPGRMVAVTEIDRAEALMHAGLVADAVEAAENGLRHVEPTGNRVVVGDCRLLLARTLLAAGRRRAARRAARAAADVFRSSGRQRMEPHAALVELQAALLDADRFESVNAALTESARLLDELVDGGWDQLADELRVERVRAAFAWGAHGQVARDLEWLRPGARSGERNAALAGWYAEAIHRSINGDDPGGLDACRSGLDLLDDIVAESPTLERRSAAMRLGEDLSQLTIELAVGLGDADTVLAAAEGTRARALHDELAEPRRHRPLTEAGAEQLRRELASRLGDRVLVEWVVVRGEVWAVVADADKYRLVRVAPVSEVRRAIDRLVVWLDLAPSEPDASSGRARRAAALLDELLFAPLGLPADVGIVLVPVDLLHGIPWSGLPTFDKRPMVIAPNAQVWIEADRRTKDPTRTVGLVLGPGVGGSLPEHDAVAAVYPDARIEVGDAATADTTRSMLSGTGLVHIAAHGRFRSDHPLLSTLQLHEGTATLYETLPERLRSQLVILSSCEGGAQGTTDGSEVLGFSAVMLARGAAAVLAPLTIVPDLECADFVADVHHELAAGEPFACAVANVRGRWLGDDDLSRWAVASSFSCFGAGAVTVEAQKAP
ncbi:MAG: CHAT domain-containing protein [Ilumatobacter sp.]|uniref:CHAT domain-containing protein n=1 Tax=Ilumatobacter sp. TaxID=1967498 RepID=UPI0026246959|nr:CHAT domain-containing protein [Ilumatobacter sp.]MDJ0770781.1 CHAT domain-containing protein [Ilumatobacter sp.]